MKTDLSSLRRVLAVALVLAWSGLRLSASVAEVRVDLREAPRGLFHAAWTIPASPGPLTLFYPRWIPGEHAPDGPINDLAGLHFTARGRPVAWRRDLRNMYAIHLAVPAGTDAIEAKLDYLGPTQHDTGDPLAAQTTSAQLAILEWNLVALYPDGPEKSQILVKPSVLLPSGWSFGTSLTVDRADGALVSFRPVTLEMLIDQPLIAGAHYRRFDLTPGSVPDHVIDCAADSDDAMAMSAERLRSFRRMPAEYAALMGIRHYETYHFLVTLSDQTDHPALEHHQCSDNGLPERALIDDDVFLRFAQIMPHEYFHSWNGKFRRPADLLSPDYQEPMQTDLLWVYEGMTEYYGDVMAARCGFRTPAQYRDEFAYQAAQLVLVRGRDWRPLQDTADAASIVEGARVGWSNRRRRPEYYREASLIWLEADMLIRSKTGGTRSLDNFVREFCGDGREGPIDPRALRGEKPRVSPYTVEDVYSTLNRVLPYDWKDFFERRLARIQPQPPLAGFALGGWKLVYDDRKNVFIAAGEKMGGSVDLRFSVGFLINGASGALADVVQDSPADRAGLGPDMIILGVNGRRYSLDRLQAAIRDSAEGRPIDLVVENGSFLTPVRLQYSGGTRYPHLERLPDVPDRIADTLKSRLH